MEKETSGIPKVCTIPFQIVPSDRSKTKRILKLQNAFSAFCVPLKRENQTENSSFNTPGKENENKKKGKKGKKREIKLTSLEIDTEASDDELRKVKKKRLETISGFVNNQNK